MFRFVFICSFLFCCSCSLLRGPKYSINLGPTNGHIIMEKKKAPNHLKAELECVGKSSIGSSWRIKQDLETTAQEMKMSNNKVLYDFKADSGQLDIDKDGISICTYYLIAEAVSSEGFLMTERIPVATKSLKELNSTAHNKLITDDEFNQEINNKLAGFEVKQTTF